ncbi:hypothetical protein RirG_069900 [Rhizophagus irregularis DAOM 197198w]|uniref:Uncharacterized protein n=1 Tax=Rhizophagus irregularis (strain DAOM 197198w) TaxID=1432141 RepID=A0A015KXT2_RHIIW|nr:hypothetical protein RirG_069900 [Rhizophagus irregularis DAOM 197198w]
MQPNGKLKQTMIPKFTIYRLPDNSRQFEQAKHEMNLTFECTPIVISLQSVPTVRCGLSRQNETTELFFGRTDENNGEFSYGKGGNIRGNQAGPGVKDVSGVIIISVP